jgi:hypothetical protein
MSGAVEASCNEQGHLISDYPRILQTNNDGQTPPFCKQIKLLAEFSRKLNFKAPQ